jgi:hypothetical protein
MSGASKKSIGQSLYTWRQKRMHACELFRGGLPAGWTRSRLGMARNARRRGTKVCCRYKIRQDGRNGDWSPSHGAICCLLCLAADPAMTMLELMCPASLILACVSGSCVAAPCLRTWSATCRYVSTSAVVPVFVNSTAAKDSFIGSGRTEHARGAPSTSRDKQAHDRCT